MSHEDQIDEDLVKRGSALSSEIEREDQRKSPSVPLLIRAKERIAKFLDEVVWPFLGACLLLGFTVWAIWWFYFSFFAAPSARESSPPQAAVQAIQSELVISIPESSPRLEFFEGNNLEIFLSQREFEAIPFPDRERVILSICRAWSKRVDHTYLPSVKIRDIRTGHTFVSYSCYRDSLSFQEVK
jgi:hypothetical protein